MHSLTASASTWQLIIKVSSTANYKSPIEHHLALCISSLSSNLAQELIFNEDITLIFQLYPKQEKWLLFLYLVSELKREKHFKYFLV